MKKKAKPKANGMFASLTPREWEVATMIAADWKNADICDWLGISQSTLDTHRQKILLKLNVRSSVGIARVAIQEGIVEV